MAHENFAEELERLFCTSQGLTCPDDLKSLLNGAKTEEDFEHLTSQEAFKVFERLYEEKRNQCPQGNFGKTAQFWMIYLQLIETQHKQHLSVNLNDFDFKLPTAGRRLFLYVLQQTSKTMHGVTHAIASN